MAGKVRFTNWIGRGVNRRLRMLALVNRQSLSDTLTVVLDQALPSAAELSKRLAESEVTS